MSEVKFSPRLFFEKPLDDDDKEIRASFVREYVYDYNAVAACLRIGFMQPFASQYAKTFMNESYVQKLIREVVSGDNGENDESDIKQIKASLKREANYHGMDSSHGARVQALGKLVSIHGMEKKTESTVNHVHRGGVLLIPAVATNRAQWELEVMSEQEVLLDAGHTDKS
jgi:hypothetical protein